MASGLYRTEVVEKRYECEQANDKDDGDEGLLFHLMTPFSMDIGFLHHGERDDLSDHLSMFGTDVICMLRSFFSFILIKNARNVP